VIGGEEVGETHPSTLPVAHPYAGLVTYSPPPPDPRYASPLAQPAHAVPAVVPAAPLAAVPVAGLPDVPRAGRSASLWLFGLLGLVLVALAGYFLTFLGAGASLLGFVLALIPFAVVIVAVHLIDRWEPEPAGLMVFAVAWGAVAAVAIALLFDLGVTMLFGPDRGVTRELLAGIVQAPLVEELGKGVGLLLIFAIARRAFDGPVDGIVYGALVGAGFAFTENIQYFAISFLEGGVADVTGTFFVRGILSPFAHAMFTAVTGFALGLAARRGGSGSRVLGPWLVGMLVAAVLHGFWNGSAMLGDFFPLYITLQVPLFVGFIVGIIALRREEARLTRTRLSDYAAAGWFTPQEVDMLATPAGRREGIAWARTLRTDRSQIMRTFIRDATALAAARQRAVSGRDPHAAEDERVLLARATAARSALLAW